MIYDPSVSFEAFTEKIDAWYSERAIFLGDPPVDAQFALDLVFKTLVDDHEHYPYLTTMPESVEQINSIMLDLILRKYSRSYRKYLRKLRKKKGRKND